MQPPFWRRVVWSITWVLFTPLFKLLYRWRVYGSYLPGEGPTLVLANHQSCADPILLGLASPRRPIWSVARKTLWGHKKIVDKMLDTYNAFPIDIEDMDMAAMRRCIDIMKAGQTLTMYPEGTRTDDGSIGMFAPGLMLLIKRAKPNVVPVAIDGAFDVWSRHHKKPKLAGRIRINIGEPIPAEVLLKLPGDEAIAMIRQRVIELREALPK